MSVPSLQPSRSRLQNHESLSLPAEKERGAAAVAGATRGERRRDVVADLSQVPLFASLGEQELTDLAAAFQCRSFKPGQVLFYEGDPGQALYLICSGQVKLVNDGADGQETILWVAGPGEHLGEMALVDDQPRSATVVALGPVQALLLYRETFLALVERRPAVAMAVMAGLAQRVRRVSDQLEEALWLDTPGRIARRLLTLAAQFGLETEEGVRIPLCLTREEFAQFVGTVRTTVSTELCRLQSRGIVTIDRDGITLHQVERLRQRSGG